MSTNWIEFFAVTVFCLGIVFLIVALFEWKRLCAEREQLVRETSRRYWDINHLNGMYHFHNDVKARYVFSTQVDSKRNFDRFQFDHFFQSKIDENESAFFALIAKINENRLLMKSYTEQLAHLSPCADENEVKNYHLSFKQYHRIEESICQEAILTPVIDVDFLCEVRYSSPQGRKNYREQMVYTVHAFHTHYKTVLKLRELKKEEEKFKQSKEYQRRKMTDALRYDILQRDHFRCQLCGRSSQDGSDVQLEVDHIIPVSKGGKTEPSNLRTLCKACNRGKRDKYDENGLN